MAVLGGQPTNRLGWRDVHHECFRSAAVNGGIGSAAISGRISSSSSSLSTVTTTTDPRPTAEPGLVNNANNPCTWCDTPNVKFFQSPSGNISCEIDYQRDYRIPDTAYCVSFTPLQNVSMNSDGVLTICTGDSCEATPQ